MSSGTPVGEVANAIAIASNGGMDDVTRILSQIEEGDRSAADQLLPLVYEELRKLAAVRLASERPGQTLQGTALVHEAYIKLVDHGKPKRYGDRRHFFAAAAQAMRRILVDRARQRLSQKRGGDLQALNLDLNEPQTAAPEEVVAINDALDALAVEDHLAAELVKLHYFVGFSIEEAAEILSVSRATAYRIWTYARTWLRAAME